MIGDPRFLPHPVEAIGFLIKFLREKVESFSKDSLIGLRLGGFLITFVVITLSGLSGWLIEQLLLVKYYLFPKYFSHLILVFSLASSLATKSLFQSVSKIIQALNFDSRNIDIARIRLSHIVGRDVEGLSEEEILRATAESSSENAVDGIFAPLFWMMIGALFWETSPLLPGPLSMAWIFKSSSTIDSMIGYKHGKLKWIGASGARCDDFLTFIPCRLVVLSLPLISHNWLKAPKLIKAAWNEGSKDISPNSGLSEAIFAHCVQVKMGGVNKYKDRLVCKPIFAASAPKANIHSIQSILNLIIKLELAWVLIFFFLFNLPR